MENVKNHDENNTSQITWQTPKSTKPDWLKIVVFAIALCSFILGSYASGEYVYTVIYLSDAFGLGSWAGNIPNESTLTEWLYFTLTGLVITGSLTGLFYTYYRLRNRN